MRVWFILAGILGIFGVLNLAVVIERLITREPWVPGQSLIAVLSLLFSFICFYRARAMGKK